MENKFIEVKSDLTTYYINVAHITVIKQTNDGCHIFTVESEIATPTNESAEEIIKKINQK
jgi:hypothetical protein